MTGQIAIASIIWFNSENNGIAIHDKHRAASVLKCKKDVMFTSHNPLVSISKIRILPRLDKARGAPTAMRLPSADMDMLPPSFVACC